MHHGHPPLTWLMTPSPRVLIPLPMLVTMPRTVPAVQPGICAKCPVQGIFVWVDFLYGVVQTCLNTQKLACQSFCYNYVVLLCMAVARLWTT